MSKHGMLGIPDLVSEDDGRYNIQIVFDCDFGMVHDVKWFTIS